MLITKNYESTGLTQEDFEMFPELGGLGEFCLLFFFHYYWQITCCLGDKKFDITLYSIKTQVMLIEKYVYWCKKKKS